MRVGQNTSSAVMQQRSEAHDSLDDFPTPPWATRALIEHVLIGGGWGAHSIAELTVREPCANRGYMVRPLSERFAQVLASDVHDYGCGFEVRDFLFPGALAKTDLVVMNPPFRLAVEFIERGLGLARQGVAVLVRGAFLEGVDRHRRLFAPHPPAIVAPFAERVPMFRGRVDPKGSSATAYFWLVWSQLKRGHAPMVRWIPPCRARLERPGDYDVPTSVAGEGSLL